MHEGVNNRYRLLYGRNADAGEIENELIRATPEQRIVAIEHLQKQMEDPDLSIRERADLLSLKARMTNTHLRMLKVYR